jgi:hypothetical protein
MKLNKYSKETRSFPAFVFSINELYCHMWPKKEVERYAHHTLIIFIVFVTMILPFDNIIGLMSLIRIHLACLLMLLICQVCAILEYL